MNRLEELYRLYRSKLVASLRRFFPNDAEDIAQETFLATSEHIDDIAPGNEWSYLARTGRNLALNLKERERAARHGGGRIDAIEDDTDAPDDRDDAEAALIEREALEPFRARFNEAIGSLDSVTQQILVLKRRGLNSKQIEATLGLKAVAVRSRLSRALAFLRARVGEPPAGVEWLDIFGDDHDHER